MIGNITTRLRSYFFELFHRPKHQIPVLDGVRTIAILLVVGLHSNIHIVRAGLPPAKFANFPPFQGGWVGVPLFFILSGYFVGGQLWKEFLKTNNINIGQFILRRGLRIWPLYYTVLVFSFFIFNEHVKDLWSNVFFLANYLGDAGPIRGAWSLATEEQFYIVMPTIVFICSHYFKFTTLKEFRRLLIVMLLIPMGMRAMTWFYLTKFQFFDINLYMQYIYRPFHTHFDGLIVGLLLSNVLADKSFKTPILLQRKYLFIFLSAVLGIGLKITNKVIFDYFVLALIFGSTIWMLMNSNTILVRILSVRIFYWTAKVSFGVYIIHHMVLYTLENMGWFETIFVNPEIHLIATYLLAYFVSCVVSSLTYVAIEAPFIDMRNRWVVSKGETNRLRNDDLKIKNAV